MVRSVKRSICSNCNRNLSQFPADIANCPYCGHELEEKTTPGMERMMQPSTAASAKKIRVSILVGQIALTALGTFLLWGSIEVYKSMIAARWWCSGPSPGTLAIPGLVAYKQQIQGSVSKTMEEVQAYLGPKEAS